MTANTPKPGGPGVRVDVAGLKAARERKGWSQAKLAHEIGSDKRVVERIESRGTAALKTLADIAEVLGVTPESLRPTVSASPGFTRGLFQLPPSLPDFTGREDELARITSRLRGGGGSVGVSSALRGMGGIGKTVTAVEACWEVRDEFPDAQLVVELRGMSEQPLTPVQAMSQVIRDFHPDAGKLPDTEAELLPLYRKVLAGKRALILLDDAKDEAHVRSLLSVGPPVAFVVTSRNALALSKQGVEPIILEVLPRGESLALLRGIVGAKGTDDELRTVAELCGRLPLALRVAGDFLRLHENWPLPKYIAALQDESKRLERLKGKTPDRDVEAVLGLSARELIQENPERAELWQMLSVFPADFDAAGAAGVWDLWTGEEPDEATATDELTTLLDRSLVQYDAGTGRYSLHDLMRPIAREAFKFVKGHPRQAGALDRIGIAEGLFAWFYCRALTIADDLYLEGNDNILRGLELFDREEVNIRHGQAWVARHRASNRLAAELCRDYPLTGVYVTNLRLSARERIVWLEDACAACRALGDRLGEGRALGNLGIAWYDLGDARKAIGFHEQALAAYRDVGDRQGEGRTLGNLGMAWAALGDARKAIGFHQQFLVIAREIGDRLGERDALGNLGLAWGALGDARNAIGFYEQALAVSRELGDQRGEGQILGNLGLEWYDLGDARKAIGFHQQALVVARELGDQRGEAVTSFNLGLALYSLGQPNETIRLAELALGILNEIEDPRAEEVRRKLAEWRGEAPD